MTFDKSLFSPDAISPETRAANERLRAAGADAADWWVVGVIATRGAAAAGQGAFPRPEKSPRARTRMVPATDREIAVRVIAPPKPSGVYLFLHGGGMVFGAADVQDPMLERVVDQTGMACVSVEYRLAPEHPYPAAWDDCEAVAHWLADHARAELGSDVLTIGGESAGAQLAVATLVRMRDRHGYTKFRGANLVFGNYDVSMTPSQRTGVDGKNPLRVVSRESLEQYARAYLPPGVDRRDPDVSPLYAKLDRMPPALLTVGTMDPHLDDSMFLYARWVAAGNDAELALYPGAPHGFTAMAMPETKAANARCDQFLKRSVERAR